MADELRIRFLDVGQGDAVVGIIPNSRRAFIVDVREAAPVLDFLEEEEISELVLFLTHSDEDHSAGVRDLLVEVAERDSPIRIVAILYSPDRLRYRDNSRYRLLVQSLASAGRRISRDDRTYWTNDFNRTLNSQPRFANLFKPALVSVVHPEHDDQASLADNHMNDVSGALLIEHNVVSGSETYVRRILLTADLGLTGVSLILNRLDRQRIQAEVLKFPHHGAWPTQYSGFSALSEEAPRRTLEELLAEVKPSIVVFSVGRDNPFGHIHPEVLKLLRKHHHEVAPIHTVAWTQRTPNCDAAGALPDDGCWQGLDKEGDIEVCICNAPESGHVLVKTIPSSRP